MATPTKVMTKKDKIVPRMIKDHNLTERYQRGEIIIETEEDPDNPKRSVTRMRKKCAYDEMCKRGVITDKQREAVERYAILCEKADGTTGDLYALVNLMGENSNSWEPTFHQHEAYEELFYIREVLGKFHTNILNKIVLENKNLQSLSEEIGWHRNYITGLVMSVFIKLEEAFNEK